MTAITGNAAFLDKAGKEIRGLMKEWTNNTIKMGLRLAEVQDRCFPIYTPAGELPKGAHRPGWARWLKETVNIELKHAYQLIRCAKRFAGKPGADRLSRRVMDFLSREQIPDEAITEVIDIAQRRQIMKREAKEIVKKHLPKPTEANQKARDTGKPHLASDGNYYFGHTKEEAEAVEQQRTLIYGIRRAVKAMSDVADEITPLQFLSKAHLHQLWSRDNERELENATKWLTELSEQWEKRYAQRSA